MAFGENIEQDLTEFEAERPSARNKFNEAAENQRRKLERESLTWNFSYQ